MGANPIDDRVIDVNKRPIGSAGRTDESIDGNEGSHVSWAGTGRKLTGLSVSMVA